MKTLKLFNAVLALPGNHIYVSEDGYVIEQDAVWAKNQILAYYRNQKLSGSDLNKTFHKSWAKVRNSSRYELALEQIRHYLSTYGSNFQDEVYIPNEVLDIPDLQLKFKVVRAYSVDQMTEKCLNMLRSGIALKEETLDDILSVLVNELAYEFTGSEGIRNKEAIVKIADTYGVVPSDPVEFLRYVIYRATGETLLIKSKELIYSIKQCSYNPAHDFHNFGLNKLATVFNRFKPLFLAFKSKCPSTINKLAKLSKVNHKPIVQNPLNLVTQRKLTDKDKKWLDNATPFTLFKALSACATRLNNPSYMMYRIRNGKSWLKEGSIHRNVCLHNHLYIFAYLSRRFSMEGLRVYIPENIKYALPTSEKMFVGNVPTGTKFLGSKLAVGVYWKDSGGASDIDLSSLSVDGLKIGWNSAYSNDSITYSGDITSAPNGAVEYLHAQELDGKYLVQTNVFTGSANCEYKIIVGEGPNVNKSYMMDPNSVMVEIPCQSVQKQTILGMLMPYSPSQDAFVLLNFGAGHARVSGSRGPQGIAALDAQWSNPVTFNDVLSQLGVTFVDDPGDAQYDFSLDNLNSDSFTEIFEKEVAKLSANGV